MASSTATISLGAKLSATGSKGASSTAVVYGGASTSGNPLPNIDNISGGTVGNLTSWLPPQRVAIGYVGTDKNQPVYMDAATWYKFFSFVAEIKLGGVNGPTLANVATDVIATKAQAAAVSAEQAAVTQQVQANAEALAATVEVSQQNALTGATQIPPVVTRQAIQAMEP